MKYTYFSPEMRLFYETMLIEISNCYKVQIYHKPHPSPMPTSFTVYVLGVYSRYMVQRQRIEVVRGKKRELVIVVILAVH